MCAPLWKTVVVVVESVRAWCLIYYIYIYIYIYIFLAAVVKLITRRFSFPDEGL